MSRSDRQAVESDRAGVGHESRKAGHRERTSMQVKAGENNRHKKDVDDKESIERDTIKQEIDTSTRGCLMFPFSDG